MHFVATNHIQTFSTNIHFVATNRIQTMLEHKATDGSRSYTSRDIDIDNSTNVAWILRLAYTIRCQCNNRYPIKSTCGQIGISQTAGYLSYVNNITIKKNTYKHCSLIALSGSVENVDNPRQISCEMYKMVTPLSAYSSAR